jgi:hypothetical protein
MRDIFGLDNAKLLQQAGVPVRCINSSGGYAFFKPTAVEVNKKYADFTAVFIDVPFFNTLLREVKGRADRKHRAARLRSRPEC